MYSQQVLEHFHHPRHRGDLASPDAIGESRYPPLVYLFGDQTYGTSRLVSKEFLYSRTKID